MGSEVISALLENEAFRGLVEGIALKVAMAVVGDILHRRASDPDFLNRSDAVFSQLSNAKTDQEKQDAQTALSTLMSGA
jgi:hypothetical protein